jgi:GNAT superfamily N-acetyltransferase
MDSSDALLSHEVSAADRDVILGGLVAYNARHGFPWPWRDLEFALRDARGTVIGGLLGETNAGWLFINALWVDEAQRGRGHGSRLLAAAEAEAQTRNCIGVYLYTYSFQARPFYERAGYRVFGELPDHPPGSVKYYLAKRFASFGAPAP